MDHSIIRDVLQSSKQVLKVNTKQTTLDAHKDVILQYNNMQSYAAAAELLLMQFK